MRTVLLCLKTSSFKTFPLYCLWARYRCRLSHVDFPGRPSECLVRIPCHSFCWHSGRIGLDTGPILLRGCFLLRCSPTLSNHKWIFFKSEFVFICVFWFFMLSTNSYISESDISLNLLFIRFSIALSSSKVGLTVPWVFIFSAAIFNLTWSTTWAFYFYSNILKRCQYWEAVPKTHIIWIFGTVTWLCHQSCEKWASIERP